MYKVTQDNLSNNSYIISFLTVPDFYLGVWYNTLTTTNCHRIYSCSYLDYLQGAVSDKVRPIHNAKYSVDKKSVYNTLNFMATLQENNRDTSCFKKAYSLFLENIALINIKQLMLAYSSASRAYTSERSEHIDDSLDFDCEDTVSVIASSACVSIKEIKPVLDSIVTDKFKPVNVMSLLPKDLAILKSNKQFVVHSVTETCLANFINNIEKCLYDLSLLTILNHYFCLNDCYNSIDLKSVLELLLYRGNNEDIKYLQEILFKSVAYLLLAYNNIIGVLESV